jgi:phage terminase small subunit
MPSKPASTGPDRMPRRSAASLHFPSIVRTERLPAPADLSESERAIFVGIVSTIPADHFRPSDSVLLSAYCRAVVRECEAAEHLAQGVVSIDNKPSAWVAIHALALKQMMALARTLKLTPLSRRPSATRQGRPQPMSYYDQMRLMESDDDAG